MESLNASERDGKCINGGWTVTFSFRLVSVIQRVHHLDWSLFSSSSSLALINLLVLNFWTYFCSFLAQLNRIDCCSPWSLAASIGASFSSLNVEQEQNCSFDYYQRRAYGWHTPLSVAVLLCHGALNLRFEPFECAWQRMLVCPKYRKLIDWPVFFDCWVTSLMFWNWTGPS